MFSILLREDIITKNENTIGVLR